MLTIPLLYHELRPAPSQYSYAMECARFAEHLDLFDSVHKRPGFLHPEITFDDGHISNFEHALPMLAERQMKAHFFITVGWTGTRTGYMGWNELRVLHAAGQTIGAHGWTHTLLTHLNRQTLDRELRGAREMLEDKLAAPVTSMSLPGGRFNRKVLAACREAGYTQVWTSIPRAETFPFGNLIGRLNIRGDMAAAWLEQLLQPGNRVIQNLERQQRIKDHVKKLLGDRLYAKLWAFLNHQEPEADPAAMPMRDANE